MSRQEKRRTSLARRNLWNAGTRIRSAELFFSKKDWGDAIRESREALDFLAQALLLSAGIEWNRFQKPAPLLLASKDKISLPPSGDWDRIEQILGESAPSTNESASFGGSDFMTFGEGNPEGIGHKDGRDPHRKSQFRQNIIKIHHRSTSKISLFRIFSTESLAVLSRHCLMTLLGDLLFHR